MIKLNYEKAYDIVSWDFLFKMLESRGFVGKWISYIKTTCYKVLLVFGSTIPMDLISWVGKVSNKETPSPPFFLT